MRFSYDGEEDFPGQWWLWEQALYRALNGSKGQQVLRDLERALVELPEKRLIDGHLSDGSGVCPVGAFVVHRRVASGEKREEVLTQLRRLSSSEFEDSWEAEEATINEGQRAGMQLTVACTIASLNDELYPVTPEERYEKMLAWVRARIIPDP